MPGTAERQKAATMHVHRGYTIVATASAIASGCGAYSPIYTILAGGTTGPVVHQDTVHDEFRDEERARQAAIANGVAWIERHVAAGSKTRLD